MKQRLDVALTEQGYFPSRQKAQAAIMAGLVFVDGILCDKAGFQLKDDAKVEVKGDDCPFVSRGGFKLQKALDVFNISVDGLVCLDIGASTGGFTDCMLQRGAKKVYAVDSGYNQLDWKLRSDSRVVSMEKENFRYLDPAKILDPIEFACADVSFISLKHIFPVAAMLLQNGAKMACLVKPQFEAGREQVGKNGIVREKSVHREVIINVKNFALESGLNPVNLSFSPVTGGKSGNIEFLMELCKGQGAIFSDSLVDSVIEEAHKNFNVSDV